MAQVMRFLLAFFVESSQCGSIRLLFWPASLIVPRTSLITECSRWHPLGATVQSSDGQIRLTKQGVGELTSTLHGTHLVVNSLAV